MLPNVIIIIIIIIIIMIIILIIIIKTQWVSEEPIRKPRQGRIETSRTLKPQSTQP